MRLFLFFSVLIFCFISAKSQSITCPINIDFEEGNLDHWQFGIGNCCPISTMDVASPIAGRHELISGTGVDYYGNFLLVPPGSGKYVLQLGNSQSGSEAEKAYYTFVVPNSQTEFSLLYKYAIVFQDPGHDVSQQPRFEVKIYKKGNNSPLECASYTYIASANLPGFKKSLIDSAILFRDWSVGSIDLTPYKGDTIIAEFSTGDCSLGGHFGYAYVDLSCSAYNVEAVYCKADSILKLKAPEGFQSYYWYNHDFSNLIDSSKEITILQPDISSDFNVIVNPYTGFGCTDTFKTHIIISDFSMQIAESIGVCDKEIYILQPVIQGNSQTYTYAWSPSIGLSCISCSYPEFTPSQTMTYTLEVTDEYGCKLLDSITIIPTHDACCTSVFIPNAFSPDNNGLNDLFNLKSEIAIRIENWSVFNRWGEKLWQVNNYSSGWDGQFQKEPQPLGTYFYILEYQCLFNNKKYRKAGDFILIR